MTYEIYTCRCGKDFKGRIADRKRGWAKSCSKSCAAKADVARMTRYLDHMKGSDEETAMADNEAGWDGHKNAF